MSHKSALSAIVAALMLSACGTPAGKVDILQSSSARVVPGSTYAWAPVSSASQQASDPRVANDIIQQRIMTAVDTALSAKGFRRVSNPDQAALLVSYHVGLEPRSEVRAQSFGGPSAVACGFRGCMTGWGLYGPPVLDVSTINYTEGTMILDLVDRSTGQLAWRATSQRRVDSSDADQVRLNAVAADMVKSLPGAGS